MIATETWQTWPVVTDGARIGRKYVIDEMHGMPVRRSGKVLLVNGNHELLLLSATMSRSDGSTRVGWFPVGGGAEGDETFAECAARELFEETGLRRSPQELGPIVAVRCGSFHFDGRELWSDEAYFFVKVGEWTVDVSGFTELERQVVTAHRWWSMAELRATEHIVFPPAHEVASLVSLLIASGPNGDVVKLSWEESL